MPLAMSKQDASELANAGALASAYQHHYSLRIPDGPSSWWFAANVVLSSGTLPDQVSCRAAFALQR
jgi:hypothetical protein